MNASVQTVATPTGVVVVGDLSVDLANKKAWMGRKFLQLNPRELSILLFLSQAFAATPHDLVSKESLRAYLYPAGDWPETNIVDVHLYNLRKKLRDAAEGKNYIETIYKKGYRLIAPQPPDAAQ